ncbi:MAG: c-type cytochrome [Polaromonas sp.]|nr:c-type cytochrome [Polaromonas sp.]
MHSGPQHQPRWRPAGLALLTAAGLLAGCGREAPVETPAQVAARSGDAARGLQLLTQYQCGSCHAIPDVPAARSAYGPSLEAFGKRSYIVGQVPNRPDTLARWIVSPASLVPGTTMPSMGVSPEEARHIAAYIGSLE